MIEIDWMRKKYEIYVYHVCNIFVSSKLRNFTHNCASSKPHLKLEIKHVSYINIYFSAVCNTNFDLGQSTYFQN